MRAPAPSRKSGRNRRGQRVTPTGVEQPTVLVTTVDIGGGKSDKIEIRRGDDPADLARAFCERHGLPEGVLAPLTEHLLDNLRKASKTISISQVGSPPWVSPCACTWAPETLGDIRHAALISRPPTLPPFPMQTPSDLDASSAAPSPLPPMQMTESPMRPSQPLMDAHAPEDQDPVLVPDHTFDGFSPQRPQPGGRAHQQQPVPLSFSNPHHRNQLHEQLSAKMVAIDPKTMLTVSSEDGMLGNTHRKGGASANRRNSRSADPSPRWDKGEEIRFMPKLWRCDSNDPIAPCPLAPPFGGHNSYVF